MVFHAIAPLSPILFQWVDFKLFGMEINQYNGIGLFMILITFVYQTIAYFFLTNLTLEPGYQIFLKLENLQDEFSKSVEKPTKRLLTYKEILLNLDIDLILVSVLMAGFMCSQFETSINIIAITNFQWSINYLGLLSIIAMLLAAVLMKLLSKLNCEISINFQSVILLINYSILINLMSLPLVFITQSRNLEVIFIMTCLLYTSPSPRDRG